MTKPEKIFFDFIRKHIVLIMAIAITGLLLLTKDIIAVSLPPVPGLIALYGISRTKR